jgi:hypothetical protein
MQLEGFSSSHINPSSILHSEEHPSPDVASPSSQSSSGLSTTLLPQIPISTQDPLMTLKLAFLQVLQATLGYESHKMQLLGQALQFEGFALNAVVVQLKLASTLQLAEQPSPLFVFPSSHSSFGKTTPSPQALG